MFLSSVITQFKPLGFHDIFPVHNLCFRNFHKYFKSNIEYISIAIRDNLELSLCSNLTLALKLMSFTLGVLNISVNRVFLSRRYRLIVVQQKLDGLKTNFAQETKLRWQGVKAKYII